MEQLHKAELDPYLLVPEAHFSNLVLSSAADLISLRGAGGGGESDLTLKRRFPSIRYPHKNLWTMGHVHFHWPESSNDSISDLAKVCSQKV